MTHVSTSPISSAEPMAKVPTNESRSARILAGYPGTLAAALVFPFLMLVPLSPVLIYGAYTDGDWMIFPAMVIGCFFAAFFSLVLASLVGALCFGVVISFDSAFGQCIPERTMCIVAGGLTGFIGSGGLAVLDQPYWLTFVVPALIAGQIGAGRGYDSVYQRDYWNQPVVWWRFDIRRILIATTWCAVVCAILRLIPYSIRIGLASLVIWLAIQTVSLYCGRWIVVMWRYWRGERGSTTS